jgi:hypothetical protein
LGMMFVYGNHSLRTSPVGQLFDVQVLLSKFGEQRVFERTEVSKQPNMPYCVCRSVVPLCADVILCICVVALYDRYFSASKLCSKVKPDRRVKLLEEGASSCYID